MRSIASTPVDEHHILGVLDDDRLTTHEWRDVVLPRLRAGHATPTDRPPTYSATTASSAILDFWTRRPLTIDPDCHEDIARAYLDPAGYDVLEREWAERAQDPNRMLVRRVDETDVLRLERGNPTAVDATFERLSGITGRQRDTSRIAVIDYCFDTEHPALLDRLWRNPREIADNHVDDDSNHHVDDVHGLIAHRYSSSREDEAMGRDQLDHGTMVVGTATRGTDRADAILLDWTESVASWEDQVDYAARAGAKILALSMLVQGETKTRRWLDIMDAHPDILFVKSAGNYANDLREERFEYASDNFLSKNTRPNLLVVANATTDGLPVPDSTRGAPFVSVAAPGNGVMTTFAGGGFIAGAGTSNAAPNVANLAAKCSILDPGLTPNQLRTLLISTSTRDPAWEGLVESGGLVDADRAMTLAAMSGLVRSGCERNEAGMKLGLSAERIGELLPLLDALEGPPS